MNDGKKYTLSAAQFFIFIGGQWHFWFHCQAISVIFSLSILFSIRFISFSFEFILICFLLFYGLPFFSVLLLFFFHSFFLVCVVIVAHALAHQHLDTELDEDSDEGVEQHEQNPGVDDGFFVGNRPENGVSGGGGNPHHTNNHVPNDHVPFPYAPGFNPNVVGEELEQLYVVYIQKCKQHTQHRIAFPVENF